MQRLDVIRVKRAAVLLRITAILETLVHPGLAAVGIGIDTDANRLTGAPSVPGNSWNTRTPLGLEAMVVLQGTTARLLKWERDAWRRVGELKATTDVASNSLEALVPDNVLAVPAEGSWRVVAAAGLGGADNSWVDGKGPIYDLGFVHAEDPYNESAYAVVDAGQQVKGQATAGGSASAEWQDHRQADVLAGSLDPSNAVGIVDLKRLGSKVTRLAETRDGSAA